MFYLGLSEDIMFVRVEGFRAKCLGLSELGINVRVELGLIVYLGLS